MDTELDFFFDYSGLQKDPHTAGQYHSYDPYEHKMGRTAGGLLGVTRNAMKQAMHGGTLGIPTYLAGLAVLWQLNINIDMRFMCRLADAKAMNILER